MIELEELYIRGELPYDEDDDQVRPAKSPLLLHDAFSRRKRGVLTPV